jgi:hypothetical protein
MDVENPLHQDNLPVATLVKVEVMGKPIIQRIQWQYWFEQIWDCVSLIGAILLLLGILGGLLYMLIWMYSAF